MSYYIIRPNRNYVTERMYHEKTKRTKWAVLSKDTGVWLIAERDGKEGAQILANKLNKKQA